MRIVGILVVACLLAAQADATAAEPAASLGNITIVQALPDATVQVSIDDREVAADAVVKDILGPFQLDPGSHEIAFTDSSGSVDVVSRIDVKAGSSSDVVLHMPAEEDGTPVVSSFNTSMAPIAAGKARVFLAHTATVAPADVRVDGQVVFTNIANGEYAEADVPAGAHSVALLPTGQGPPPILGPLDVTLPESTMTMVYAVGSPTTRSMDVVAHTANLESDGSAAPDTIDTGSAGLAAERAVTSFGSTPATAPAPAAAGRAGRAGRDHLDDAGPAVVAGSVRRARHRPAPPSVSARPPRTTPRREPHVAMTGRGLGALAVGLAVMVAAGGTYVERSGAVADGRTGTGQSSSSRRLPSPSTRVEDVRAARRAPSAVVAEGPELTRLPSGAVIRVRAVGTTPSGLLAVPGDIDSAGWWRGGSRLGDPFGSTLIAAHIDSTHARAGALRRAAGAESGCADHRVLGEPAPGVRGRLAPPGLPGKPLGRLLDLRGLRAEAPDARDLRASVRGRRGRVPEPRRDRGLPDRPARTQEVVMAGKQKPPRPLGEKAGLGDEAGSRRPAGSPTKQRPSTGGKGKPPPRAEVTQQAALEPTALEPTVGHVAGAAPPAGDRSSRARGVLLVAGLLLIGSVGVVLIRSVGQDPEAPGRLSTTSAQPAAPVPVRAGSSYVATTVLPNGSVSVSHWVRPRTRAYELTLSVPDVPGRGSLRAADVRVDVDGTAVPGPASIESSPHTYVLAGGRQIFVTYHLTGALERSPSVEGRALVRVTSLDLSVEDVMTRTQAVEGVEILSMACTAHTERALDPGAVRRDDRRSLGGPPHRARSGRPSHGSGQPRLTCRAGSGATAYFWVIRPAAMRTTLCPQHCPLPAVRRTGRPGGS